MYEELMERLRTEECLPYTTLKTMREAADAIEELSKRPEIPTTGIGDLSDGYHTFNGLYYQRMVLFVVLVRTYKEKTWKSWKHEDGEPCFGGGWFIVGIDTPQGSYTYHYEDKYWNWFECEELPVAKHWDGHTEEDVTRLLSLPDVRPVVRGKWKRRIVDNGFNADWKCSECGYKVMLDFVGFNFEAKRQRDDAVKHHGFEKMLSADAMKHYPNIVRVGWREYDEFIESEE